MAFFPYTEPERIPGKVGPHRESHEPRLLATLFKAPAPPPLTWDGTHGIKSWGMDCNGPDPDNPPAYPDGLGDCGAAAPDHGNMAKANNPALYGTLGKPVFGGTIDTYFAYGVAMGEQGEPPAPADEPDQGVDNSTWLGFLYTEGIIDGYGEVPLDQIDGYAVDGNGLLLGINCADSFQQDFGQVPPVPWGQPGENPDPELGHDVWYIKYNPGGVITWGAVQPVTDSFVRTFVTDAWLIFDRDDPEVNWALLDEALEAIHGTVTPPAPVPPPVTPPTPPPPAPPKPTPEVISWWEEFVAWIKSL